jgi:3-phenylpropionate/cinnamic acid dioxygenase small subunit
MSSSDDPTVDRLADRAAIADQMFRYARATDWLETDQHREVFAEDCVFASPHSGDVAGVDAVVAWMDKALAPFEATQHLIGNISIEFTGTDTATAVSYVRAWHRARDRARPDMVLWGEYHDRWAKVEGRWRIKERRVLEAGIEPRRDGGVPNPRRAKG